MVRASVDCLTDLMAVDPTSFLSPPPCPALPSLFASSDARQRLQSRLSVTLGLEALQIVFGIPQADQGLKQTVLTLKSV
jgi:hypothetical protein